MSPSLGRELFDNRNIYKISQLMTYLYTGELPDVWSVKEPENEMQIVRDVMIDNSTIYWLYLLVVRP